MVCGEPLRYLDTERQETCHYCGEEKTARAVCLDSHFVCDSCHSEDALEAIENVCLRTDETDMLALLKEIRSHPAVPMHGPEHHSLVPAVILTAYANAGGNVPENGLATAIARGAHLTGGSCAFLGICGAASGVAVAFSILKEADPLKGPTRQAVQKITCRVLERIASYDAARCCQRDCWLALRCAAELSEEYLPIRLKAESRLRCRQQQENSECLGTECPLWPGREPTTESAPGHEECCPSGGN
jgi:hypothetical protein